MKKMWMILLSVLGGAGIAAAQVIVDEQFTSAEGYANGNIAGQADWVVLQNTDLNGGTYALDVDTTAEVADSGAATFSTNGNFIYWSAPSAGNDVDDEWTGVIDFKLKMTDTGGPYLPSYTVNHHFLNIGLVGSTTNGFDVGSQENIGIGLRMRGGNGANAGQIEAYLGQSGGNAVHDFYVTHVEHGTNIGWTVYDQQSADDFETDNLRLTFTIRKTRDIDTYTAWGSITNLDTGYSVTGKISDPNWIGIRTGRSSIYSNASPVFAIGIPSGALLPDAPGGAVKVDTTIDSISFSKASGVLPTMVTPANVSAVPYSGQVTLGWDHSVEAADYTVMRATDLAGPYASVGTTNGTSFVDTTVVNETEYFYKIEANYTGVGSVESAVVSATPKTIYTGPIFDIDFTATDYSDGDLAGQQEWKWITSTASNAFNVSDSAGTGIAGTAGNSFDTSLGNHVYLAKLMDNNQDHTWSGSMDFTLTTGNAPGQSVVNITHQGVLGFGLTDGSATTDITPNQSDVAGLAVTVHAGGHVLIPFGTSHQATRIMAWLSVGVESGWDPENGDTETDPINVTWTLRKSREEGIYTCSATLSNKTTGFTSSIESFAWEMADIYDAQTATFAMGHLKDADEDGTYSRIDIAIDSVSLEQTSVLPVPTAPSDLATLGSDRTVTLSWSPTFESSSYEVLFSETSGGPYEVLASQPDTGYADTPRWNDQTGYYKVRSVIAGVGSADSVEVEGTPTGTDELFSWGVDGNVVGSSIDLTTIHTIVTNGTILNCIYGDDTPLLAEGYASYKHVDMFGILQGTENWTGGIGTPPKIVNVNDGVDRFEWRYRRLPGGPGMGLIFFKAKDWSSAAAIDATTSTCGLSAHLLEAGTGNEMHLAIRNGSTWYVSQTLGNTDFETVSVSDISLESWGVLTVADTNATALMSLPGSYDTSNNGSFTDINAIGFFVSNANWIRVRQLKLTQSTSDASYDYWAGLHSLTGDDALGTSDPDEDGLDNNGEMAYGGDPNDPNDQGTLPQMTADVGGFYYTYIKSRDPDTPYAYEFQTTDDLAGTPFANNPADYTVVGEGDLDYYWTGVTNFVPTTDAAKFMKVDL